MSKAFPRVVQMRGRPASNQLQASEPGPRFYVWPNESSPQSTSVFYPPSLTQVPGVPGGPPRHGLGL